MHLSVLSNDDFNIDDFDNEWNDENVAVYDDSSNDDHEVLTCIGIIDNYYN